MIDKAILLWRRLFPEKPEYGVGDEVLCRFKISRCEPTIARCRIHGVNYWYGKVVYDVFVLEDKGWVWWGFKSKMFPSQIIRKGFEA